MSLVVALLLPLLALSPFLSAATPTPEASTIPPVVWQTVAITNPEGETTDITDPDHYTVQFLPDGSLLTRADCNRGKSTYELVDGKLVVHPGMSTLVLCPPESHDQAFTSALHGATSFAFDEDGQLHLTGSSGELVLQATLEGVVWQWEQFEGSDGVAAGPTSPSQYTLTFLPDGKLAVKADCNRGRGTWSTKRSELTLSMVGVTRAACSPDSLSNDFLDDLQYVRSYVFRDGKLYLSLMADAGIMTLVATYDAAAAGTPVPEATPQG